MKNKSQKKLILALISVLALIAIGALIFNIFVRPPDIPRDTVDEKPDTSDKLSSESPDGEKADIQGGNRKEDFYTFVLCGTDDGGLRTDTIMVASFDNVNKKFNLVSVPRDSMLNVDWSTKKVNASYAFGGIDLLKKELSRLLGFEVDFYATLSEGRRGPLAS